VFTARYALSPYIKQIRFAFKGLILSSPLRLGERARAHTHTHTHTRIYIYIYIWWLVLLHERWIILSLEVRLLIKVRYRTVPYHRLKSRTGAAQLWLTARIPVFYFCTTAGCHAWRYHSLLHTGFLLTASRKLALLFYTNAERNRETRSVLDHTT
jgi:hypothetical protein